MTTSLRSWRWAPPEEWDEMFGESPSATPFHGRPWCETYAAFDRRFDARALAIRLEHGHEVLMPLLVRRGLLRKGPFARAVAMQPGVYGGPLSSKGPLGPEDWASFVRVSRSLPFGRIDCFGSVLDPLPTEQIAALAASARTTHAIALKDLSTDSRSTFSKGCKHALTKAKRAGVSCGRLESLGQVDEYFDTYLDSVRRWGKDVARAYPRELFQHLYGTPSAELWVARLPTGEIAACGTFLFSSRHCVWWHGAMREKHTEAAPTNALIHALIDEARSRDCDLFDFNPSGGHAGVDSFKRSFGASPIEFSIWSQRSTLRTRLQRQSGRARGQAT